jgi:hypothetical protein
LQYQAALILDPIDDLWLRVAIVNCF